MNHFRLLAVEVFERSPPSPKETTGNVFSSNDHRANLPAVMFANASLNRFAATLVAVVSAVALVGCEQSTVPTPPAQPPPVASPPAEPSTNVSAPAIYLVKGVVEELLPGGKVVRIHHEEIPGYMKAMSMPLDVKDPKELAGVKIGDKVFFRMLVTPDDGWIDRISVLQSADGKVPSAVPSVRVVRDVEPLKVGDALPGYPLTNQFGKLFHTADFKGQALAITFIFTRCPFPDFCPRISKGLADAHRLLREQADGPKNWHLLSLSFDVEFDTPQVLQRYGKVYAGDSDKWTFANGAIIEIDDICERFGVAFTREPGGVNFSHRLRTVVIDTRGRVHHIFLGNEWTAEQLMEKMIEAARVPAENAANSK